MRQGIGRGREPDVPKLALAAGAVVAVVVLDALGLFNGPGAVIAGLFALVATVAGVRMHRPSCSWPWWMIAGALSLFITGAIARNAMHTLGNLGHTRSLVPDVIVLPGYVLLAVGLLGFSRGPGAANGTSGSSSTASSPRWPSWPCAWVYRHRPRPLPRPHPAGDPARADVLSGDVDLPRGRDGADRLQPGAESRPVVLVLAGRHDVHVRRRLVVHVRRHRPDQRGGASPRPSLRARLRGDGHDGPAPVDARPHRTGRQPPPARRPRVASCSWPSRCSSPPSSPCNTRELAPRPGGAVRDHHLPDRRRGPAHRPGPPHRGAVRGQPRLPGHARQPHRTAQPSDDAPAPARTSSSRPRSTTPTWRCCSSTSTVSSS